MRGRTEPRGVRRRTRSTGSTRVCILAVKKKTPARSTLHAVQRCAHARKFKGWTCQRDCDALAPVLMCAGFICSTALDLYGRVQLLLQTLVAFPRGKSAWSLYCPCPSYIVWQMYCSRQTDLLPCCSRLPGSVGPNTPLVPFHDKEAS
jgi:hypothetical protein